MENSTSLLDLKLPINSTLQNCSHSKSTQLSSLITCLIVFQTFNTVGQK